MDCFSTRDNHILEQYVIFSQIHNYDFSSLSVLKNFHDASVLSHPLNAATTWLYTPNFTKQTKKQNIIVLYIYNALLIHSLSYINIQNFLHF